MLIIKKLKLITLLLNTLFELNPVKCLSKILFFQYLHIDKLTLDNVERYKWLSFFSF